MTPRSMAAFCAIAFAACTPRSLVADASDVAEAGADDAMSEAAVDAGPIDSGIHDRAYTPPMTSRVVAPGVRREAFNVESPAPPENPMRHIATPAERNRTQVIRYRQDTPAPVAAQTVYIAMPGFLGGAGGFDPLARALVTRGASSGHAVEVWAIDRRANLLEDLRGMDAADALGDPEVAAGYYLRRDTSLNGAAFAGFIDPRAESLAYMSEWGLPAIVADLDAVVALVPQSRDHVVLVGHSLGASMVEAYAAWDFAGTAGSQKIAGLVLLDGVLAGTPLTETEYYGGRVGGGIPSPGVDSIRATGPVYFALPLLGVRATVVSEIVARRALADADAVVTDPYRDNLFRTLLGITMTPPMSNAAAFGFALDDHSCPLAFAQMSLGSPLGATRMQPNPFGMGGPVTVPANATDTFRWTDAPNVMPAEFTSIGNGARAWAATPTNFSEWYFPTRLTVDVGALPASLQVASGSYQAREGIRAIHGGEIDVPLLGISTALTGSASAFDAARPALSSTVGANRPHTGATRSEDAGFRAFFVPGMTHIDPLTGDDDGTRNPVPSAVETFGAENTVGSVVVPLR